MQILFVFTIFIFKKYQGKISIYFALYGVKPDTLRSIKESK